MNYMYMGTKFTQIHPSGAGPNPPQRQEIDPEQVTHMLHGKLA